MFLEVVSSKLLGCLTSVTKPLTQLQRDLCMTLNTTLQGHEPSGSVATKEWQDSEEGAACSLQSDSVFSGPKPQVFMTLRPWISIPTAFVMYVCAYACVYFLGVWFAGVLCIISGVLNDLCSMCNWVALPEISMGLTLKLSFILGRLQWAGWTSQDRDLTGGRRVQGCSLSSFQRSSWCKTLLTSIYEASQPILSQSGIYELINASYISANIIFRMGLSRGEIVDAR